MTVEVKLSCPLGSKCEEAKDGALHRCHWYMQVRGVNHNTGETVDEWRCAMAWMPMLLIENSGMQRSTSAAIESFRNETIKANIMNQRILLAKTKEANADMKIIEASQ